MTGSELATLLHAKKVTRGKWVARCPSHSDRKPSLSIADGKKAVVIKCMSAGCETREILKALGLTWSDLFYTSRKMTPELRSRLNDEDVREKLERQLGLVIMLGAVEVARCSYWAAAERRIRCELTETRCKIEPSEIYEEYRAREFQSRVARVGWDALWGEIK